MVNVDDGTGKGFAAKVTSQNQLLTKSISRPELIEQAIQGLAFSIGSGLQVLTNDVENALLYIKNNEDLDLVGQVLNVEIGNSTAGLATEDHLLKIYINPTGGTLISGGAESAALNKNLGSSREFLGDIRVSNALAQTLSGSTIILSIVLPGPGRFVLALDAILPKGSTAGFSFTPKGSNTNIQVSMDVEAFLVASED